MANGSQGFNFYVDDIPMKLSEKFRPLDFSLFLEDEIDVPEPDDGYNFQVELFALETAELREKMKMLELKKSFKNTEINSELKSAKSETESNQMINALTSVNSSQIVTSEKASLHHHMNHGEILMPQLKPLTTNYNSDINSDNKTDVLIKKIKKINPADFENESSPFDNVELQTIDYMQELNNVFQAVSSKMLPKNNTNYEKDQCPSTTTQSGSILVNQINGHPSYNTTYEPTTSNWNSLYPNDNYFELQNNISVFNYNDISSHNNLRSSKSVSDLPTLINSETATTSTLSKPFTKKERSHTPPCFSHSNKMNRTKQTLVLHDPYDELSNVLKQFVSKFTSMGFDRSRVARAVRHLSDDDKKVLDFLLQVQSLEDEGYDSCEAEIALHMNNYQYENAKKFLDSLKQLAEVGFSKDAIVKALVKCDNDRDKALDALLNSQ